MFGPNRVGEIKTSERLPLIGELSNNVNNSCCNRYGAPPANQGTKTERRIDSALEKGKTVKHKFEQNLESNPYTQQAHIEDPAKMIIR